MSARVAAAISLLAATLASGCHEGITEVVVVVTSDLQPSQARWSVMLADFSSQDARPLYPGPSHPVGFPAEEMPATMGITSGGQTQTFSGLVALYGPLAGGDTVLVERAFSGVDFVPHETRMLVMSLESDCIVCRGASCPTLPKFGSEYLPNLDYSWGNLSEALPGCDLVNPPTLPFDPSVVGDGSALLALGDAGSPDGVRAMP